MASRLSRKEPGESLRILDGRETQSTVTCRLDDNLQDRWARKTAKILSTRNVHRIPFAEVCRWLEEVERENSFRGDMKKRANTAGGGTVEHSTGRSANITQPTYQRRSNELASRTSSKEFRDRGGETICHCCNKGGHRSPNCPERDRNGKNYSRNGDDQDRTQEDSLGCNGNQ